MFETAQWAQSSEPPRRWRKWRRAAQAATQGLRPSCASGKTGWRNGSVAMACAMPGSVCHRINGTPGPKRRTPPDWRRSRTRIAEIDKELAAKFPYYAALASPAPLTVQEVQAQLRPERRSPCSGYAGMETDARRDLHLGSDENGCPLGAQRSWHGGADARGCRAPLRARRQSGDAAPDCEAHTEPKPRAIKAM